MPIEKSGRVWYNVLEKQENGAPEASGACNKGDKK